MRGDIYLYHDETWFAHLIQWHTHGPYNHSCVEVEEGHVIEAVWPVVKMDVPGTPALVISPVYPNQGKLEEALLWLHQQVGHSYDVFDLLSNVADILPFYTLHIPVFRTPEMYTCSELAMQFLLRAGATFPRPVPERTKEIALVSPNDLARYFSLLPEGRVAHV